MAEHDQARIDRLNAEQAAAQHPAPAAARPAIVVPVAPTPTPAPVGTVQAQVTAALTAYTGTLAKVVSDAIASGIAKQPTPATMDQIQASLDKTAARILAAIPAQTPAAPSVPAPVPPVTPAVPGNPIIAVWYQPAASLPGWKSRGINTLLGYEPQNDASGNPTVSTDQWCAAATSAGLKYYLQRTPDTEKHINDANCLGWLLGDEPNGGGAESPAQVKSDADGCRAVAKKPVLVNLDGWKLQWESDTEVAAYCEPGDLIAFDYYVINRGEGPAAILKLAAIVDRLKSLAPGRPIIPFIECSFQNLAVQDWAQNPDASGTPPARRMRCPMAAEMALEITDVMNEGAAGIAYFPQVIGRNFEAYDGTPADLITAMTTINAALAGPAK